MKLSENIQLVIKKNINEISDKDSLPNIVHIGPGHVVINVTGIEETEIQNILDNPEIDDNYYFRFSITENLIENKNEARCYLTKSGKTLFRSKRKADEIFFLGLEFIVIEVINLGKSKPNGSEVFKVFINRKTIDPKTGVQTSEEIWSEKKSGRIENYLPEELEYFKEFLRKTKNRVVTRTNNNTIDKGKTKDR